MSAHTPGPWCFTNELKTSVIRQDRADGEFPMYIATTWGGESEADARLIAAAPDLLTALQQLVNAADNLDPQSGVPANYQYLLDMAVLASAAIVKATGIAA